MQLISLYIKKYNHLEEFTIEFKQKLSVIIGVNGSGKSSVLEVIAKIFSTAYLGEKAEFPFKLTYKLSDFTIVELSANASLIIKMNGKTKIDSALLPSNVVVYYSGLSDKMEKLCKPHEDKQRADFKGGNFTQRPFFYYRPENFKIFLLALFAFEFGDTKDFLLKKIQLTGLNRFNIEVNKPPNFKKLTAKSDNFWGLEGENREFCDRLDEFSDDKIVDKKSDNFIKYDFNSINNLYALRDNFDGEKQIFEHLDMLAYEGMLGELTILLEKQGQILSSDTLSEGEKQIIAIRGINDLLINENTLLLFDEPDTYLHPSWQAQFMEEIIKYSANAQFVITTHSPQLISNSKKGELHILKNGQLVEHTNNFYGRDINAVLTNYMSSDSRPKDIQMILDDISGLITTKKYADAKEKLSDFKDLVSTNDSEYVRLSTKLNFLSK